MGDEFEQYKRPPQAEDDDEFAQYKRGAVIHAKSPSFTVDQATRDAAARTQQGTETTEQAAHPQMDPFAPLISGRTILNLGARAIGGPAIAPGADIYGALKTYSESPDMHTNTPFEAGLAGAKRGLAHAATDTADIASGFTSPPNLALAAAGGLGAAVPEAALAVKPLMGIAGAGFAGAGAKDIWDIANEDKDQPLLERLANPDRLQRMLLSGAQVAGGAAGVGETSVRGALNRNMDVRLPNEPFTPRQLLDTARAHDINLDLSDATGGKGLPKMAKHATMHGLTGSGPFDAALEHNVGALDRWGTDYLDQLSPRTGEAAGARIQEALKRDYEMRKGGASQEFEDLDRRVGPNTIDGTRTVEAQALAIRDQMKPYYDKHPELVPRQAWGIVNNLAERPKVTVRGPQGVSQAPAGAHTFSWSELHQLRSDLMDIYRNNPDLVKSRADAWLQQMVKTIDDTMTSASAGLTPADRVQFRHANDEWEALKNSYDNPQNPLYHAVRAQMPSQVAGSLLNIRTPEFARSLRGILGNEFGDLQRAAAENILGRDRTGAGYDFKSMPGRLTKYKPEYLHDLLGPAAGDLLQMSRIGAKVTNDINPSGSGKLLQKYGELTGTGGAIATSFLGHPLVGAAAGAGLLAERGIASGMNSPKIVDFLTDARRARAIPRGLPIAAGVSGGNQRLKRLLQEAGIAGQ